MTDHTPLDGKRSDYLDDLPADISGVQNLLQSYSNIPADEVETHLRDIRDRAWKVFPYGCIGRWLFLDCVITSSPAYQTILERLQAGDTLLDAGCAFGYVLRQLALDGAPPENLFGADLHQGFIDLGYELFRDHDSFAGQFVAGDLLAADDHALDTLDGKIDIIHASALFHLFDWDDQVKLGCRLVRFFKSNCRDPLLVGRQIGDLYPPDHTVPRRPDTPGWYRHNLETWQQLWDEVGQKTGTKWKVVGTMRDTSQIGGVPSKVNPGRASLNFVITKI